MTRHDTLYVVLLLTIVNSTGCDDTENNSIPSKRDSETQLNGDSETQRDTQSDTAQEDTGTEPSTESETQTIPSTTEIENEWGFPMRLPDTPELDCDSYGVYKDIDFICTIEHDTLSGIIYIQNSPSACNENYFPTYESPVALIKKNNKEKLEKLSNPFFGIYEAGTNSEFEFDYGDRHYLYDHSIVNEWGIPCHLTDCLIVSDKNGEIIQNGCNPSRTLPIVCVSVDIEGNFDSLVDTLPKKCPFF